MPLSLGGLGYSPPAVGAALSAFSLLSALWQAFMFLPVYNRFGAKKTFVVAITTFIPMFLLFPMMNVAARHAGTGVNAVTIVELTVQGLLYVIMDMGFSEFPCTNAPVI
jgi:hypothetical protein